MTAPLDLAAFVRDGLAGPKLADELREASQLQMALMAQQGASVKQLARDIDTAYGPVERKAALCDYVLDEFAALIAACKTSGRLLGYNSGPLDRAEAALAKAREGVGA